MRLIPLLLLLAACSNPQPGPDPYDLPKPQERFVPHLRAGVSSASSISQSLSRTRL